MARPMLIVGPPGSGKTQRAVQEAARIGNYVTIGFGQLISSPRPWLIGVPDAVIVEEVPQVGEWPNCVTIGYMRSILNMGDVQDLAPRFILISEHDLTTYYGWGNQEFEVITVSRWRGQGNKHGSRRTADPKTERSTQRYTYAEMQLIKSVAGDEVGTFIHDAAVDRARQFAEAGEVSHD